MGHAQSYIKRAPHISACANSIDGCVFRAGNSVVGKRTPRVHESLLNLTPRCVIRACDLPIIVDPKGESVKSSAVIESGVRTARHQKSMASDLRVVLHSADSGRPKAASAQRLSRKKRCHLAGGAGSAA